MAITLEDYNFRRMLRELRQKEGRGTELISLYIPPGRSIYDVLRYLRHEYEQAGNIKDKNTRKNVQSALESIIQRLKLFRETPPNGLAVFCGAIPQERGRGSEKIEIYVIEPPEPVPQFMYRCDREFFLEPLEEMAREKEVYGLIVMDRGGAVIGVLQGASYRVLERLTSDIPPKHSAGGQSQRRFERIREERVHNFFKKVGRRANEAFLPMLDRLKGIIVGGPGDAREKFVEGDYLHYELKKRVLANLPTSYTEEQGLRELIMRAQEIMGELDIARQRRALEEIMSTLAKKPELVAFGAQEVVEAARAGRADKIVVLEEPGYEAVEIRCAGCGYSEVKIGRVGEAEPDSWTCPVCRSTSYDAEMMDFVEYLGELARQGGAELLIIEGDTEWGEQLRALGGVAAILRY